LRSALGAFHRHRLTVDSQVRRRDPPATVDESELEGLAVRQIRQAGLLDRRDVNEHILAAVIANDETETLLRIEELYDALAFADDLGRHSAATAATAAATEAAATAAAKATASAAAEAITATAAATAEAITAAAAKAIAAAAVSTAAAATTSKAAAVSETAAITEATAFTTEKIVALVTAATTAVPLTPSIETHARLNSFVPTMP
jgi:CCR4-NOT transcriptional regulation complex NOT5 subunit